MFRIAIIGGGPKAAAIAAKASAMRQCGHGRRLEIHVFEKSVPGSAWSGGFGYSDGSALLCTPALRDLGFPYAPNASAKGVAETMLAKFSWISFLMSRGDAYARWVDRDCPAPTHKRFAEYVQWVIEKAADRIVTDEVIALECKSGRWTLALSKGGTTSVQYDAVVITGSGPPLTSLHGASGRVFNGRNFWLGEAQVHGLVADPEDPFVIVGAGGTAAAVVSWLLTRRYVRNPIVVVGSQATLHARVSSAFENRLFGDDDAWTLRSRKQKRLFLERLDGGTVWSTVLDRIASSDNLVYLPGRADRYVTEPNPAGGEPLLWVVIKRHGKSNLRLPAAVAVDCRGFDALWFRKLFDASTQHAFDRLRHSGGSLVDEAFALRDPFLHQGLHVPGCGADIGPAARNLMALGWMADRILAPYV